MEREESPTSASPRRPSYTEAQQSNSTFGSLPDNETTDKQHGSFRSSPLERRAVEMYCDVLLGHAHFLFFNSKRVKDTTSSVDLYAQGKKILDEAEATCMKGKHPMSDQVIAKCWYVRGFRADIDRNKENAASYFEQAVEFDKFYETLKRVRHYQHREGDEEEIDGYWSRESRSSEYGNKAYRTGEVGSTESKVQRSSLESRNTGNTMDHVKKAPRSRDPVTPTSNRSSAPIVTPSITRSPDRIKELMDELRNPAKATRRPSEDILNHFKEVGNSTQNDPLTLLLEKRQAEEEAAERKRCFDAFHREDKGPSLSARKTSHSVESETRSTDTPIPDHLDTQHFGHANRSAASPTSPNITINTQGARRISITASTVPSVPSSPLRKSSLPGEVDGGSNRASDSTLGSLDTRWRRVSLALTGKEK